MPAIGCVAAGCALVSVGASVGTTHSAINEIGRGSGDRELVPPTSTDGSSLNCGAAGQLAAPAFSEGAATRNPGYRHDWPPEHDALVHLMIEGVISTGEAARRVGVSAVSIRYRARRLGLVRAPLPALKGHELPERLTPAHGWVPICHKAESKWIPLYGAPLTMHEAAALRDAGRAFTAHKRVDGGFDFCVKVRT